MKKVIVVVGPTAVGKTKLAVKLAKKYNTEIISGDSVAVYKRLDIGSAKPTIEEMDGIKHHLIDYLEPTEQFDVATFQREARKIIDNNDLSIICGGTGLYIQSVLFDYEFKARKRDFDFNKQFDNLSNEKLYALLKEKDPSINEDRIHPNNRKRVLRALEILDDTSKSINEFNNKNKSLYDYFIVYLSMPREILYDRIDKRVDIMINDGLIDEVKKLYDDGIYPHAIGYSELISYFNGEISLESAILDIKKNTRHLAKRQETWFKNQLESHFYDMSLDPYNEIINDIDRWLK